MTTATEIMLKQRAGELALRQFFSQEPNMTNLPVKTDMESLVRILIRNFEVLNFGAKAKYIYLPTDLYDHFTDFIEDQFRGSGVPEHALDQMFRHFYLNVEVLNARTNDIIVTDELLP
jgi:hypothetical protein